MCKALDDLMEMKKNEGRAEGRAMNLLNNLMSIMSELKYTADQAMDLLEVPEEERDKLRAKL